MTAQTHRDKQQRKSEPPTPAETPSTGKAERARSVSAETDDLLDEIDALLNEVGQDVVDNFVQIGGQ